MTNAANVGSELIYENDTVAIWNFVLEVGEETAIHTHDRNYVWYAVQGSSLQVFDRENNDVGTLEVPTNCVYVLKIEDGFLEVVSEVSKGARVPVTHKAKNVGASPYREILVEFK